MQRPEIRRQKRKRTEIKGQKSEAACMVTREPLKSSQRKKSGQRVVPSRLNTLSRLSKMTVNRGPFKSKRRKFYLEVVGKNGIKTSAA